MNPSVLDSKAVLDYHLWYGENCLEPDLLSVHNNTPHQDHRGVPVSIIDMQDKRENLSSDKPIRKLSKKTNLIGKYSMFFPHCTFPE